MSGHNNYVSSHINNKQGITYNIEQLTMSQEIPNYIDISLRFQSLVLPWKYLLLIKCAFQTKLNNIRKLR